MEHVTATPGLREVLRYRKAGRIRVYSLRMLDRGAELWVAVGKAGRLGQAKKRVQFSASDDVSVFLEDVEQTLRRGEWTRLTP